MKKLIVLLMTLCAITTNSILNAQTTGNLRRKTFIIFSCYEVNMFYYNNAYLRKFNKLINKTTRKITKKNIVDTNYIHDVIL